jgi:hypothetical protein
MSAIQDPFPVPIEDRKIVKIMSYFRIVIADPRGKAKRARRKEDEPSRTCLSAPVRNPSNINVECFS